MYDAETNQLTMHYNKDSKTENIPTTPTEFANNYKQINLTENI